MRVPFGVHRLAILFIVLVVASASPAEIRYDDAPEQRAHPLTADGGYGIGIPVHQAGQPYTISVVLSVTHPVRARLISARPVAQSPNLEVLGALAGGPDRRLGIAGGSRGFPPTGPPWSMRTRYLPLGRVPVTPARMQGIDGVDVLIGVRLRAGHRAWLDGIEVTYEVDGQRYVGRFPVAAALCDQPDCQPPAQGLPWDGTP